MKEIRHMFYSSVFAGALIGIGATAKMMSADPLIGALLFCVGLYSICAMRLHLFTGKVGFLTRSGKYLMPDFLEILLIWAGNFLGAGIFALALSNAMPEMMVKSIPNFSQSAYKTVLLSIQCGILVHTAVWAARTRGHWFAIFICVPVFILCGFEHSVADMFIISVTHSLSWKALGHIGLVSLGNAIGALLTNWLADDQSGRAGAGAFNGE